MNKKSEIMQKNWEKKNLKNSQSVKYQESENGKLTIILDGWVKQKTLSMDESIEEASGYFIVLRTKKGDYVTYSSCDPEVAKVAYSTLEEDEYES